MRPARSTSAAHLRAGVRRALDFRARLGLAIEKPCDVLEAAAATVDALRFVHLNRGDGAYLNQGEDVTILVSSLRPWGRQRYTVAHELGHHVGGHGTVVDEDLEDLGVARAADPDELVAEGFARYLLMPRPACIWAVGSKVARPSQLAPSDIYSAAALLGVGYTTLLTQMRHFVTLMDDAAYRRLLRAAPRSIKLALRPDAGEHDVWPLDPRWDGLRVHVQVGDLVLGVARTVSGEPKSACVPRDRAAHVASEPGRVFAELVGGGTVEVCVARPGFRGLYDYRYFPEVA